MFYTDLTRSIQCFEDYCR